MLYNHCVAEVKGRALIVGGTGLVGNALLRILLRRGWDVATAEKWLAPNLNYDPPKR